MSDYAGVWVFRPRGPARGTRPDNCEFRVMGRVIPNAVLLVIVGEFLGRSGFKSLACRIDNHISILLFGSFTQVGFDE